MRSPARFPASVLLVVSAVLLTACGTDEPEPLVVAPPEDARDAAGRISETALEAHFLRIRMAADRYRSLHGTYPEDAIELVEAGFLHPGQERDPWGNPYALDVQGGMLSIVSHGADGKPGGVGESRDRVSSGNVELR